METLIVETKRCGRVEWNLNSECREAVAPIAAQFGMPIERFLQLYTLRKLPGQLPRRDFSQEQDHHVDHGFDFESLKKSTAWKRIERAAKHAAGRQGGESVTEFLSEAIMDLVRCYEEEMILSPRTGEVIGDAGELAKFKEFIDWS
jgi:hypothetical protein